MLTTSELVAIVQAKKWNITPLKTYLEGGFNVGNVLIYTQFKQIVNEFLVYGSLKGGQGGPSDRKISCLDLPAPYYARK